LNLRAALKGFGIFPRHGIDLMDEFEDLVSKILDAVAASFNVGSGRPSLDFTGFIDGHKDQVSCSQFESQIGRPSEPVGLKTLISNILDFTDKDDPVPKLVCQLLKGLQSHMAALEADASENNKMLAALTEAEKSKNILTCCKLAKPTCTFGKSALAKDSSKKFSIACLDATLTAEQSIQTLCLSECNALQVNLAKEISGLKARDALTSRFMQAWVAINSLSHNTVEEQKVSYYLWCNEQKLAEVVFEIIWMVWTLFPQNIATFIQNEARSNLFNSLGQSGQSHDDGHSGMAKQKESTSMVGGNEGKIAGGKKLEHPNPKNIGKKKKFSAGNDEDQSSDIVELESKPVKKGKICHDDGEESVDTRLKVLEDMMGKIVEIAKNDWGRPGPNRGARGAGTRGKPWRGRGGRGFRGGGN
jgi:hypothetical protein